MLKHGIKTPVAKSGCTEQYMITTALCYYLINQALLDVKTCVEHISVSTKELAHNTKTQRES